MMDLFASGQHENEPLASRMRPGTLNDFVGQEHLVGEGHLLRRAIESDQLTSLVLYGPPGTGKTTLAHVIASGTKSRFVSLSAVLSGVADIRNAINEARDALQMHGRKSILFVDEVHRWNKSQQDALLPWVESGTVILIGATTENPYFEVNKALVSRSHILQLKPLSEKELSVIGKRALEDPEHGYGDLNVAFQEGALEHLVRCSSGDARNLLNAIELAVGSCRNESSGQRSISIEDAEESMRQRALLYDKNGDYHYDCISAFIKSIRGSDPDASLYWLARMIQAGEDPHFIFRRMLISAAEDVGMANPGAICIVEADASSFDRVGMPEGQFHLAHAAIYLATCLKSNSALGFFEALSAVKEQARDAVPSHLKDASRDGEALGDGKGYKYPHDSPGHWVSQQYLPDSLTDQIFYKPGELGYEGGVRKAVMEHRYQQKGPEKKTHTE